jgi:hypothetical protein
MYRKPWNRMAAVHVAAIGSNAGLHHGFQLLSGWALTLRAIAQKAISLTLDVQIETSENYRISQVHC